MKSTRFFALTAIAMFSATTAFASSGTYTPVEHALDVTGVTTDADVRELYLFQEKSTETEFEEEFFRFRDDEYLEIYDGSSEKTYLGAGLRWGFMAPGTGIDMQVDVYGSVSTNTTTIIRFEQEIEDGELDFQSRREFTDETSDFGRFGLALQADIVDWNGFVITPHASVELDGVDRGQYDEPELTRSYGVSASYVFHPNVAVFADATWGDSGELGEERALSFSEQEIGIAGGLSLGPVLLDGSLSVGTLDEEYRDSRDMQKATLGATFGSVRIAGYAVSLEDLEESEEYISTSGIFSDRFTQRFTGEEYGLEVSYQF